MLAIVHDSLLAKMLAFLHFCQHWWLFVVVDELSSPLAPMISLYQHLFSDHIDIPIFLSLSL